MNGWMNEFSWFLPFLLLLHATALEAKFPIWTRNWRRWRRIEFCCCRSSVTKTNLIGWDAIDRKRLNWLWFITHRFRVARSTIALFIAVSLFLWGYAGLKDLQESQPQLCCSENLHGKTYTHLATLLVSIHSLLDLVTIAWTCQSYWVGFVALCRVNGQNGKRRRKSVATTWFNSMPTAKIS